MRHAHTILDVAEMLSHYEVTVLLTDISTVEFHFPRNQKESEKIQSNQSRIDALYGNYKNSTDSIQRTRQTRYVVRSLVSNPRFWRLTTVASQLGNFRISNNRLENSKYGQINERKKRNSPLHIQFTEQKQAKRFFEDIASSPFFGSIT